jgi:hypothetical protein
MAPGWIDWLKAEAREVILFDLVEGLLPLDEREMSAREAWDEVYQYMPEFVGPPVVFSQFEARLKGHREQVNKKKLQSVREVQALERHLALHPAPSHNHRGEPIWNNHPAKALLVSDVKDRLHIGLIPSAFQKTRTEYLQFKAKVFKGRIYQENRRQKYILISSALRSSVNSEPGLYRLALARTIRTLLLRDQNN